jgi:hypothetical protein
VPVLIKQDHNSGKNFHQALQLFLQRTLNESNTSTLTWWKLHLPEANDDDPTRSSSQVQRDLRLAKALPTGVMPMPNNALRVEWFYMSF